MRDPRLGDDIDDFCVRCKRIMNHAIVSVLNNEPAKVRCRTCHNDHDYRHEQAPPPKVDLRKDALFSEVLKKVSPADADAAAVADAIDPELETVLDDPPDGDELPEAIAEAEPEPEPEPATVIQAPKPKAKAAVKARGKGRKA